MHYTSVVGKLTLTASVKPGNTSPSSIVSWQLGTTTTFPGV